MCQGHACGSSEGARGDEWMKSIICVGVVLGLVVVCLLLIRHIIRSMIHNGSQVLNLLEG